MVVGWWVVAGVKTTQYRLEGTLGTGAPGKVQARAENTMAWGRGCKTTWPWAKLWR